LIPTHTFSIDIEDYFQVSNFEKLVDREQWQNLESRVVQNSNCLLDLLERYKVLSVCYVLGWVADRYPDLVKRISDSGHVVASHSYWHRLIYDQKPVEFAFDLAQSCKVLESITGKQVDRHRAPSFSLTKKSLWAVKILQSQGIAADSSVVPILHDRYGIPNSPSDPYRLVSEGKLNIPIGGGGYFRILPWWFTRWALKRLESQGKRIHFYIHPWEIDPEQPRIHGLSLQARFRHYRNLHRTSERLEKLFSSFSFGNIDLPSPPIDSSYAAQ
jgi:polysaccharide deacetylase family protein (PEP-CTERM system associated)